MRKALLYILLLLGIAAVYAGNRLNAEWEILFNGENLDNWEILNGTANYEIVDDAIVGTTVKGSPNTFLCTKTHYANFILEYEFKIDDRLNSGVQIRSNSKPEYQDGRVHGYQVEIDPSERAWTCGIYDEARRGWLYDLRFNQAGRNAFKHNEWNKVHIEAVGSSIRTWLNGVPCANLVDSMTPSGFIALQVHSAETSGMQVMWRNIRILDLGVLTEFPPVVGE